ncbi:MAG: glycosyltransferase family 4 protein [Sediminibacterium sp.]|nr:glycosyltransferase family 4 protein [Chitinophagaceae bacterium]MCA6445770.1 glycosyltransferase family 4 protein [Chitinophagaceae bacterium]
MSKKSILFVTNVDWFFVSHRLIIAEEAKKNGFDVYVACEDTGSSAEIISRGVGFINLSFSRSGINPVFEIITLIKFLRIYITIKPDIVHHITLKPVIYGSLIAKILRIKSVVNAVSGLGYNFTEGRKSITSKAMIVLMKFSFQNSISIIFQNKDDFKELSDMKVLSPQNKIYFIKGSGVSLQKYYPTDFPDFSCIRIAMPCRMLWDKGVKEFHEAAELLRGKYFGKVQFILVGKADSGNKACVPTNLLMRWNDGNYFKWVDHKKNIFEIYEKAHIIVLPSYREGMPKTLIEACAMGRAIITTDAIGCRECVDEGINGLKVPVKDISNLALAMQYLISNPSRIIEMGRESRLKAEKEFDIINVISKHLEIYKQLV